LQYSWVWSNIGGRRKGVRSDARRPALGHQRDEHDRLHWLPEGDGALPFHVCNGATLMCPFGASTSSLVVLPIHRMITSDQPAANINDHIPMVNVMTFGMCISPSNPAFVSATAAAMGTPTPVPCIPVTPAPWVTGAVSPPVILDGVPALDDVSTLTCLMGGVITIVYAGESTEMIN
jgi:hypothetical protein